MKLWKKILSSLYKADSYLLIHYPEVWLSRIHFIIPATIILFMVELLFGSLMSLSTNLIFLFSFLCLMFLLFIALWWRFQKQFFDPNLSARASFRLFLCNTISIIFLIWALCFTPLILSKRAGKVEKDLKKDLLTIRIDNIPDDQIVLIKDYIKGAYDSVKTVSIRGDSISDPLWLNNDRFLLKDINPSSADRNMRKNLFLTTSFTGIHAMDARYPFDTSLLASYTFIGSAEDIFQTNSKFDGPLLRSNLFYELFLKRNFSFLEDVMDILMVKSIEELREIKENSAAIYDKYGLSREEYTNYFDQEDHYKGINSSIKTLYFNIQLLDLFTGGLWLVALFAVLLFSFLSIAILLSKNIWLSFLAPIIAYGILILLAFLVNVLDAPSLTYTLLCMIGLIILSLNSFRKKKLYTTIGSFKLQILNYAVVILPLLLIFHIETYNDESPLSDLVINIILASSFLGFILINYYFIREYRSSVLKPTE